MEIKKYLNEVWRPVKGYEGLYEVSNYGRVKSLDRVRKSSKNAVAVVKGRILKSAPGKNGNGYPKVVLCKNGERENYYVHRLVMEAFVPNPDNLPCINHKDESRNNNFVFVNEDGTVDLEKSNLEWCTYKYNLNYGTVKEKIAESHIDSGKPIASCTENGTIVETFEGGMYEAQRKHGYNPANIHKAVNNKISKDSRGNNYTTRTAYGYYWKYI